MRIVLALFALTTLLAGCGGNQQDYCVGSASDGSCQYFEAPINCTSPDYCANAGGYTLRNTKPDNCTKISPLRTCP